jgi:hypothetical protein
MLRVAANNRKPRKTSNFTDAGGRQTISRPRQSEMVQRPSALSRISEDVKKRLS